MKFQAKQTVNSLIITTLLVVGASFAIFYPATGIPTLLGYSQYPYDYFYQYRADQKGPEEETVRELAKKYKISLKDWGDNGTGQNHKKSGRAAPFAEFFYWFIHMLLVDGFHNIFRFYIPPCLKARKSNGQKFQDSTDGIPHRRRQP